MMDNAELRTLISAKLWPAVVERARSHPHEVGGSSLSSLLCDERGYTVLHAIAAYHRDSDGRELVPAIRAILHAADVIVAFNWPTAKSVKKLADADADDTACRPSLGRSQRARLT
jgi:hypothetical protein